MKPGLFVGVALGGLVGLVGTVTLDAQIRRLRFVRQPTVCTGCTAIQTTDVAQTIVNANPAGTVYLLKSGTHRLDSITAKTGDTFVGETGAVLSGAKALASESFVVTAEGFWRIGGQTHTPAARVGGCQTTLADNPAGTVAWATTYAGCDYAEELFRDDVRQLHVTTAAQLGPGKWYFDDAADQIFVGDNPIGHVIETSVTTFAFNKGPNTVTIRNLTIEKYASTAQYGCINAEDTTGWVVEDSVMRNCHSGGIRIGHGTQVLRSLITRNGEIGVVGIGDNVRVEDCEISWNNGAHFDPGWEGGGSKFVLTNNLIVRNNWWHHNEGPGLWLDIYNINYTLDGNLVEDNQQMGIFTEISYAGVISNNTVRRNGLAYWVPGYVWGAGILNAASPNVEVFGNVVSDNRGGINGIQQNRGTGSFGPHEIENFYVHDNTITMSQGAGSPVWSGLSVDVADDTYWTSRNNRFRNNTYFLDNDTFYFTWNWTGYVSFAAWQGYGHDVAVGSTIAYDTAAVGASISSTTQTTPMTISTTADRLLLVGVLGDATTDYVTGVTFNGAALTLVDKQNSVPGSVYWQYLWALLAPSSGTHNIVVTASTSTQLSTFAASYTGVLQTGQPNVASETSGTGNPYTMGLTTTLAGSWTAGFVNASVGLIDSTGFTTRSADTIPVFGVSLGDSNGPHATPGAVTMAVAGGGGQKQSQIVAFGPVGAGIGGSATVY